MEDYVAIDVLDVLFSVWGSRILTVIVKGTKQVLHVGDVRYSFVFSKFSTFSTIDFLSF